jgi:hypothetical protein
VAVPPRQLWQLHGSADNAPTVQSPTTSRPSVHVVLHTVHPFRVAFRNEPGAHEPQRRSASLKPPTRAPHAPISTVLSGHSTQLKHAPAAFVNWSPLHVGRCDAARRRRGTFCNMVGRVSIGHSDTVNLTGGALTDGPLQVHGAGAGHTHAVGEVPIRGRPCLERPRLGALCCIGAQESEAAANRKPRQACVRLDGAGVGGSGRTQKCTWIWNSSGTRANDLK